MKRQAYNPYLPEYEYVPDGEPHLFEGRVYIYGSHDEAFGSRYCQRDYVTWSAPEDDLSDWRYEGVIYTKTQDPSNSDGKMDLWAPDVCRGADGRYYLYYCFSFYHEIGVAVSDSPAGPFSFYGHVRYPDSIREGAVLREFMPFDPAVLNDDGRIYLYYGFAPAEEKEMKIPDPDEMDLPEEEKAKFREIAEVMRQNPFGEYGMVAELESDMVTLKEVPRELIPGGHHTKGTGFEGHGFFEASSIRKVDDMYYFVYSSHKSHELCYATSRYPDRDFEYGGILVSNGDIGIDGNNTPTNVLGNNHGGMVEADGQWYIFYHRQTNGTECSRQGCAEKIKIEPDGKIRQAEITSCGLNDGPLAGEGTYPAYIACHITDPTTQSRIDYSNPVMKTQTRVTSTADGKKQYITDITDGSRLGYKYFRCEGVREITAEIRGEFRGTVRVCTDKNGEKTAGEAELDCSGNETVHIPVKFEDGVNAVYFFFTGTGKCDMTEFTFIRG